MRCVVDWFEESPVPLILAFALGVPLFAMLCMTAVVAPFYVLPYYFPAAEAAQEWPWWVWAIMLALIVCPTSLRRCKCKCARGSE